MAKIKRVLWNFLPLDYKVIKTYLEEMASKGWMLEKVGLWTAKFRAIEPRKIEFYVDVFKGGGPLLPEKTLEAEEYRKLCEESGWIFVTSRDYLQFFYAEKEESPTPLQTDEALEQKIVESTLWKTELIAIIIFLLLGIRLAMVYSPTKYRYLLNNVGVISIIFYPLLSMSFIIPVIYNLVRIFRYRKNIKDGLAIESPDYELVRKRMKVSHIISLVSLVFITLAFIADSFFRPKVVAMSLSGPSIGVIIGLMLRWTIKKKASSKADSVLYIAFAILGIFVFSSLLSSLAGHFGIGPSYKNDTIPEGYPIITMSDLSMDKGVLLHKEFNLEMSPLVHKHYTYSEIWTHKEIDEGIYVRYYNTAHPYIAKKIFKGIIAELERGMKWRGMTFFQKTMVFDGEIRDLWGLDELAFTEEKDVIILGKGRIIVRLDMDLDFEDKETMELLINKFFN